MNRFYPLRYSFILVASGNHSLPSSFLLCGFRQVAMKGSPPAVIDAADEVTTHTVEEDGVPRMLERLLSSKTARL